MGRGRQKAKQRKVARELKYFSPEADYSALEAELANARGRNSDSSQSSDSHDPYEDDEYLADSWSRR